jgi:hypothetical protein
MENTTAVAAMVTAAMVHFTNVERIVIGLLHE